MELGMTILAWTLLALGAVVITINLIKEPPLKELRKAIENIDPNDEEEW